MAEFWSNNDRGYRLRLWVDETSINESGNSSSVRVRLALLNTTTTFTGYTFSAFVDINGQRLDWSGSPSMLSWNSETMLIDRTINVTHDSDGTKTIGFMARLNGAGGYSPNTLEIGGSAFKLSDIARSSSFSSTTYSGEIGGSIKIDINKSNSNFRHNIKSIWYGKTTAIANNVDTTFTWSVPQSFATDIPTSSSGTGSIVIETYNNGTKLGEQSVPLTLNVPDSIKPTFERAHFRERNQTLFSAYGEQGIAWDTFVQVISTVEVLFAGARGVYGSTISGYYSEIVGKNLFVNSQNGRFGLIDFSGRVTVNSYVIDSRGKKSNVDSRDITVIPYTPPTISFEVNRAGSNSDKLVVNRNVSITPINVGNNQKNTMRLEFRTAPEGTNNFTTNNGPASGSWTSIDKLVNSQAELSGTFSPTQSFTIIGKLSDRFTSTEFSYSVSTERVVMSYTKDGNVGIGKVPSVTGSGNLDVHDGVFGRWGNFTANVYANDLVAKGWIYYANGRPSQMHNVTEAGTSGSVIYESNWDGGSRNANDIYNTRKTSLLSCDYIVNMPTHGFYFMINMWQAEKYGSQLAIQKGSGKLYARTIESGVWSDWKEYVDTSHPALSTSSWTTTGVDGVNYKRIGDVVYLSLRNVTMNAGQNKGIGSVPSNMVPYGGDAMMKVTAWTADKAYHYNLQIGSNGGMTILAQGYGHTITTQISWAI